MFNRFVDDSKLIDYSYPWATFSDLPRKIKIYLKNPDHVVCWSNGKVVNETFANATTLKVAETMGRIPGYVRGGLTRFTFTSGCK